MTSNTHVRLPSNGQKKKACSMNMFLTFLRLNPKAEEMLRQRMAAGKPLILRGVSVPHDVVREALNTFSSTKIRKRPADGMERRQESESDIFVPEGKRLRSPKAGEELPNTTHSVLPDPPSSDASIATLKEYFTHLQVEYRHRAFEREDLLQLLNEITETLSKPLDTLRSLARIQGSAVECLRIIVNPARRESAPVPSAPSVPNPRRQSAVGLDAIGESTRICRVHEVGYSWFYTVLGLKFGATVDDVQKQFRFYMKCLHPDKFRNSDMPASVVAALEKVKKAKKLAEEELNRINVSLPGQVRSLTWRLICAIPRQRIFALKWQHPEGHIDKYTIQVLDPLYGRFLNICVLEPDYYEEKQKFVGIDELNEYVIEEKKLEKMQHLFDGTPVEFQVAAHNIAGIGPYVQLKVDLSGKTYAPPVARMGRGR